MHLRRLQTYGVMDVKVDEKELCLVKQGPEWRRFDEQYGLDITEDCLPIVEFWEAIEAY